MCFLAADSARLPPSDDSRRHTWRMAADTNHVECQVCGDATHAYTHHLGDVEVPEFVHLSAVRLRKLEMAGADIDVLVVEVAEMQEREDGGRKAWAIWLHKLLVELEDAADAPEVAAEIEEYLLSY